MNGAVVYSFNKHKHPRNMIGKVFIIQDTVTHNSIEVEVYCYSIREFVCGRSF